jgi:hypothetical protein
MMKVFTRLTSATPTSMAQFFTFRIYEIYKGKYWFHPKNFEILFCSNHVFYRLKVMKREKKQYKIYRLSRGAAVDKILCHAYSLDHRT